MSTPQNTEAQKKQMQDAIRRKFEADKEILKTIYPTSDEDVNPEYAAAVKLLAEAYGIIEESKKGGANRKSRRFRRSSRYRSRVSRYYRKKY